MGAFEEMAKGAWVGARGSKAASAAAMHVSGEVLV
jgi:hypothetical protein